MIEKILYVNLDRRPDRNEWFLGEMETAGVPMEMVERVPGKDWKDFYSIELLLKAMEADGFLPNVELGMPPRERFGSCGNAWSQCCYMRKIIASGQTTLVMQDDAALAIPYEDLLLSLKSLEIVKYIQVIQLEWVDVVGEWARELEMRPNHCEIFQPDFQWAYGIRGFGDKAVIYTPFGAAVMLGIMQSAISVPMPPEASLYQWFNNYESFHTAEPVFDPDAKIKWGPHRDISDIHVKDNPEMLR